MDTITSLHFNSLQDAVAHLFKSRWGCDLSINPPAEPAPVTYSNENDPDVLRTQRDGWQETAEARGLRLDAITQELAKWQEACRAKDADIDSLIEQRDRYMRCSQELDKETERLHAHWHGAAVEVTELRDEVKRLTEQRDGYQAQLIGARAGNKILLDSQDKLKAELDNVIDAWNKDHQEMKRKLDAATAPPPPTHRDLVLYGDTIQDGDEVWEFGQGPWGPVSPSEHGQQYRHGYFRMRRKITPA